MKDSLKPMQRQYVHLSEDRKTVIQVGTRHDQKTIILKIVALQAYQAGILFYQGKQKVWLSEAIPSQYQQDE